MQADAVTAIGEQGKERREIEFVRRDGSGLGRGRMS